MFCYVAALKIHSHGKVNYSLPKDKKGRKEKWLQEQITLIYSVPKH